MSFTREEISFLEEVSRATFEESFEMWIIHMEEGFCS